MESQGQVSFYFGIITAMLAFVLIAGGFVVVVVRYQKRLLLKRQERLRLDAQHKQELLLTSIKSGEAQRLQLAKDIHDEIGSIFSTLSLSVNQIEQTPLNGAHLQASKKLLQSGIDSVRRISHALVPFELELLGLEQTLENHFETLASVSGLDIDFESSAPLDKLSDMAALAIYRIVQELCTNCLRHARATRLGIKFTAADGHMTLSYHDDGNGAAPKAGGMQKGIGLKNIESRIILLNGSVSFNAPPGTGFSCEVKIPLTNNSKP